MWKFGDISSIILATVADITPIVGLIVFFQLVVFRRPIPHLRKVVTGLLFVIIGLSLFLIGLEKALFPVGEIMAKQLSDPEFVKSAHTGTLDWTSYYWIYIFAAAIGFSTTIAEPSLIAVAFKANEVSGGTISQWGLRVTVGGGF
jgi:hypothetical protein